MNSSYLPQVALFNLKKGELEMAGRTDAIDKLRRELIRDRKAEGVEIAEGPYPVSEEVRNWRRYNRKVQISPYTCTPPKSTDDCKRVVIDWDEDYELAVTFVFIQRLTSHAFGQPEYWTIGWESVVGEHHHTDVIDCGGPAYASRASGLEKELKLYDLVIWKGKEYPHVSISSGGELPTIDRKKEPHHIPELFVAEKQYECVTTWGDR